jgi:DNA polymerase-1
VRLARESEFVACDIETGAAGTVNQWTIKAFSISDGQTSHVLDPRDRGQAGAINDCLHVARTLVFHNSCYDVPILVAAGLMSVDDIDKVEDTIIISRLAWPDSITHPHSLGVLAGRVLGGHYQHVKDSLEDGFKAVVGGSKSAMFDRLDVNSRPYVAYAAFDTVMTARVYRWIHDHLVQQLHPGRPGMKISVDAEYLNRREQTVNRMLLYRSAVGIEMDHDAVDGIKEQLRTEAGVARAKLLVAGLDPDLPATKLKSAILDRLDAQGRVPASWPRLKDGSLSTRKDWMVRLEDVPEVEAVGAMLQADRFIKDYSDGSNDLAHNGRIRPQVSVQYAVSGRMSYSRPAVQQFPGAVRRMFRFDTPATSFDWSSIEPLIMANLAGEHTMLSSFEAGGDIYLPIAERAGVERKVAKTVLLAQLYGQGVSALALRLNLSEDEARSVIDDVKGAMPAIVAMSNQVRKYGNKYGVIQTVSGRTIPLPADPRSGNHTYMGYKGVNYLVQGSAYDLLAEAMYAMHTAGIGREVYLAVHDELVVNTAVAHDVEQIMLTPPQSLIEAAGRVPVLRVGRTDLGRNWESK